MAKCEGRYVESNEVDEITKNAFVGAVGVVYKDMGIEDFKKVELSTIEALKKKECQQKLVDLIKYGFEQKGGRVLFSLPTLTKSKFKTIGDIIIYCGKNQPA